MKFFTYNWMSVCHMYFKENMMWMGILIDLCGFSWQAGWVWRIRRWRREKAEQRYSGRPQRAQPEGWRGAGARRTSRYPAQLRTFITKGVQAVLQVICLSLHKVATCVILGRTTVLCWSAGAATEAPSGLGTEPIEAFPKLADCQHLQAECNFSNSTEGKY